MNIIPASLVDETSDYVRSIHLTVDSFHSEVCCFLYCISGYVIVSKRGYDDATSLERAKQEAEGQARLRLKDFLDFLRADTAMRTKL